MRNPWVTVLCLSIALPAAVSAQVRSPKSDAIEAIAPRPLAACTMTTAIACGQTLSGSLAPSDCTLPDGTAIDYYQFSGTNNESITATLTTSAFPPILELIDPNSHVKTSNSSGAAGTVQVPFTLDSTGVWSLAVNNNASTPQYGAYTLKLACGSAAAGCIPNDTTLCIGNGRFSVQATFDAGGGNTGPAHAVALTNDTGYLWFFSASAVEAVVKLVDGCALNSRFWVFAGGLTDVKVTMTVTDTMTNNTQKMYTNPQGTAFQPIQDTSAFSTCP